MTTRRGDLPAKPRRQCKACPWRVGVDAPRDIPGGYCETKHAKLKGTIRSGLESLNGPLRVMACHEYDVGAELPCVGWLANQLGPGNNIALRLRAMRGELPKFTLRGEQHETFEDTLPGGAP